MFYSLSKSYMLTIATLSLASINTTAKQVSSQMSCCIICIDEKVRNLSHETEKLAKTLLKSCHKEAKPQSNLKYLVQN